ncbi:MarR family transcriptional regulator [Enterococcus sp. BWM-S5]|uniref:MarR family transcriptional regulator n=1 Tax=Enterococcus larvae TaxID=2794352 RepID=A0ABS4CH26_9ENTE|nr:MarR family transcriptional regulator [Enterococcus larvae]
MNTGYLLINISKQLRYHLNQALISNGITIQQWAVLQQLSSEKEAAAAELAAALDMDKPTISGIIKRLVKKEYLIKKDNPRDSRSYILLLTKSGEAKALEGRQISDELLTDHLSMLTAEEQQTLNVLLSKINQNKKE